MLYADLGFTCSPTVLLRWASAGTAFPILDAAGISLNGCALPWDLPDQPTGLHLGTQVVTRRGMAEAEMERIAEAIARVLLHGDPPDQVLRDLVTPLALDFQGVAYSLDASA